MNLELSPSGQPDGIAWFGCSDALLQVRYIHPRRDRIGEVTEQSVELIVAAGNAVAIL